MKANVDGRIVVNNFAASGNQGQTTMTSIEVVIPFNAVCIQAILAALDDAISSARTIKRGGVSVRFARPLAENKKQASNENKSVFFISGIF